MTKAVQKNYELPFRGEVMKDYPGWRDEILGLGGYNPIKSPSGSYEFEKNHPKPIKKDSIRDWLE